MANESVKWLITMANSCEEANWLITQNTECKTVEEKINFLEDNFDVPTIEQGNSSDEEIYRARLEAIIKRK